MSYSLLNPNVFTYICLFNLSYLLILIKKNIFYIKLMFCSSSSVLTFFPMYDFLVYSFNIRQL